MKRILFAILIGCISLGWVSCSEDFEVAAPYKDITIAYGLLSINDTVHYIRVQKGFIDEHKSAISMAQEPDSNYYPSLEVRMKEFIGNSLVSNTVLPRVNLSQEGIVKDSGMFFREPNYVYKFSSSLNAASRYRLVITNLQTSEVDSSEISIVDTVKLTFPSFTKLNFDRPDDPNAIVKIVYRFGKEISVIEGILRFHWVDVNMVTGVETEHSADYPMGTKNVVTSFDQGQDNFDIRHSSLFSFLRDVMGPAPANVIRQLDSCELVLNAAGPEYANYVRINQVQSGGLTADQIKPLYTNILGADAYGLFASRASVLREGVQIDSVTFAKLRNHTMTEPLKIQGFTSR